MIRVVIHSCRRFIKGKNGIVLLVLSLGRWYLGMQASAATVTPNGGSCGGLLELKAIMRVRDFSVRHTTRAPQGDRSLPLFSRGSAMLVLAGGILIALAGTLSAQAPPAAKGAAPPAAKPAAPALVARPTADAKLRAQMAIDKPLMTQAEDKAASRRIKLKIGKILKNGVLNAQTTAMIDDWIQWRLYRMTITELPDPPRRGFVRRPPAAAAAPMQPGAIGPVAAAPPPPKPLPPIPFRRQLPKFNDLFLREIKGAAKDQNSASLKKLFRKYVFDGIITKSQDLLDNNFYVRLNVVMLLNRLDIVAGGLGGKGSVSYAEIAVPLMDIMRDKDQSEPVKIAAVQGLKRVLLASQATRDQKNAIAVELMSQLDQKASMYWYPWVLVEAIGCIDEPLILQTVPGDPAPTQKPFHVQKLVDVMRDQNRPWIVRSEAAKSLGRISLHPTVRSDLIAHEIVVLSGGMSAAYNKNPNQFYWQQCFLDTYLAFKPLDATERARITQVKPATLISKFAAQKAVSDTYKQILPPVLHILKQPTVINGVLTNAPIPVAILQAQQTWSNDNKPSVDRVAPGLPQLQAPKPMAAKGGGPAVEPTASIGNK